MDHEKGQIVGTPLPLRRRLLTLVHQRFGLVPWMVEMLLWVVIVSAITIGVLVYVRGGSVASTFGVFRSHSTVTCASFPSQAAAQAAYRSDPVKYRRLDGDKNGVACQSNKAPHDIVPVGAP